MEGAALRPFPVSETEGSEYRPSDKLLFNRLPVGLWAIYLQKFELDAVHASGIQARSE